MNCGCPPPTKRLVRRQAGILEPRSTKRFDESVGPTAPRHDRDRLDLIVVLRLVHRRRSMCAVPASGRFSPSKQGTPLSWSRLIPSRRARLREAAPECAPPPPAVALRSSVILFDLFGAPSKTRTPDPLIRSKPESRTMGKRIWRKLNKEADRPPLDLHGGSCLFSLLRHQIGTLPSSSSWRRTCGTNPDSWILRSPEAASQRRICAGLRALARGHSVAKKPTSAAMHATGSST